MPRLQSAYRAGHSTETALLKVTTDILTALDSGDLASLALLDMSAAFDTVDHNILLRRLQTSYGIRGVALDWFRSYLTGRLQYVRYAGRHSATRPMLYGVPQGSVLGPILFILYTADLAAVIEQHGLLPHLYADDTQIVGSCRPTDTAIHRLRVEACIADVASWMSANRLQLNVAKTELMWCSTSRRRHQVPIDGFTIGQDSIQPVAFVRDLGLYLDSTMSMRDHVSRLTSTCFGVLRQIRCIRRNLTRRSLAMLVTCFVFVRLDYCNATLVGLPRCELNRLQAVQNAAVRLVAGASRFDHVTPLLRERHWLPVHLRVTYKLAVMVFKSLAATTADYLTTFTHPPESATSLRLRSANTRQLHVPRTRTAYGDRAFAVAGPRLWNSLPDSVKCVTSLCTFKQRLKTHLFRTLD
jgi:hypothetical protein